MKVDKCYSFINSASQIPQEGRTLNSRSYRPREDIAREVVLKPGLPGQGKAGEFKEEQHSRQEPLDKGRGHETA